MRHTDRIAEMGQSGFTIGYDLSTVRTWVRIVVGVVASLAAIAADVVSHQLRVADWSVDRGHPCRLYGCLCAARSPCAPGPSNSAS